MTTKNTAIETGGENMEITDLLKEKRRIEETHSYAASGEDCESCPNTPSRCQAAKKSRNEASSSEVELTLNEVQNNIIQILSGKINERADELVVMIKKNSSEIESMSEALNSIHIDVNDLKKDSEILKTENVALKNKVAELESKVNEQERYSRRWCLRLLGVAEDPTVMVKSRVEEICKAMVPENKWMEVAAQIDVAHRLGRLKAGEERNVRPRPRPIIMRFVSRSARDFIWQHAKKNEFLKSKGYVFKEDLTSSDKEARRSLWPAVEKARKEGKSAYFSGGKAFIDGREVKLSGN